MTLYKFTLLSSHISNMDYTTGRS